MAVADIHPSPVDLEAFALGTLDNASLTSVETHLADCPTCQECAAGASGDSVVELLRRVHSQMAGHTDTVAGEPVPGQAPAAVPPGTAAATLPLAAPPPVDGTEALDAVPPELARHERYRIVRLLGEGGMGAVYEAEHRVMQRPVALKVINRTYTANAAAVERFRREVRAAARLSHPNIVTTHDAEDAGNTLFLVMEYVKGVSLGRLLKQRGPLPVAEACNCVRQAALGLQHAHERGMVHRDVKPDNLILARQSPERERGVGPNPVTHASGSEGLVKLLDFGLAALTAERGRGLTDTNVLMGTPDYMAPEQAEDPRTADIRADVYSLGCTLYHLLTGSVPYPAPTPLLKILAHREQPLPSLRQARPDVPPELAAVVARMMAKKPEDRYQTPGDVAAALEPFAQPAPVPPKKRRRWLAAALVALLLAGVTVAGAVVYRIQTDKGELVITTESDDVEVIVKQGGKVVRIIDTKTNKEVRLDSGVYDLELKGAPEGLKLTIDKATLTRGKTVLATIERVSTPLALNPAGQAKDGDSREIRRFEGHEGVVRTVAYSPDGRHVLSGSGWPAGDHTIRLWDAATGKELRRFEGNFGNVVGVAFCPTGRYAVSCHTDGTARLLDVATLKEVRRFEGHVSEVEAVAFSPDGHHTLTGGMDGTIRLWDVDTGKEVGRFIGHSYWVVSVAFSPDGHRIASASLDKTIRVWDVATGKEVKRLKGPGWVGPLRNVYVAYSPDGRFLLSGDMDGRLRLWEIETGKEVRSFAGHPSEDAGLGGVAFSPDGRRALSGGAGDKKVRLWDVETGKELSSFAGHRDAIWSVAFSPDGGYALSGGGGKCRNDANWTPGGDWTLRLWRLPDPPAAKDKP